MKTMAIKQTSSPLAEQYKMARVGLDLTVRELAQIANVNKATIVRIEAGMSVRETTAKTVREQLEAKGARFLTDIDSKEMLVAIPKANQSQDD